LSTRAIFFDRDGVVNVRRVDDYVKTWDEFAFLPDIFSVLPRVREAGYLTILVTNQRGIARSLMSEASLATIHERMQAALQGRTGHRFDAIYYCPHDRDAACDCRKPLPGMLLQAAAEHGIDLAASWMIGDSESDIEAGIAAGCRTVRVTAQEIESAADFVVPTLQDAWRAVADHSAA